ncbi:ABC transporter permease subunit [Photobacterium sp. WH77]|uniref:ABC transporter permease subunit n=1 Tax=Photobacterium arenosum TaxID=2774143 RepID=A0ABR9BJ27_9GAMM|nr:MULTISPECIES: ABC transporter permease subunit [Photobacterium]MBD8512553.1 ABC transporter permease subunit [Photobacterium arenosum]MBV7260918.1 ABC transporter permease subunit [Photobacterium sp. WH24]MCG2838579.1 ABC transporter permease subunit [Photobacterium sp. WH77]MCG2846200.1 ABC transporter permease subunit [Photobacterium sp. WH80]MDO6580063.1 ABC transporter permease subunit [Photobacterium sp. 2_MG-2023]
MFIYTIRRLNLFLITLFILTLIGYSILRIEPSSYWNLHEFWPGWLLYLDNLMVGNLGLNQEGQPILSEILQVFPATLELCFFAFILSLIVGIPLGTLAGVKRGRWVDTCISSLTLVGYSLPLFWLAMLFIMLFSLKLGWLPVAGRYNLLYQIDSVTGFALIDVFLSDVSYRSAALIDVIRHLVLPTLVLAIAPTTEVIRLTRASVADVMQQNFIRVAQTKGLSMWEIIIRHALKNAIPPIIPKLGMQFSTMMTFAMLTESIFNWPGIGRWLLDAIATQNYVAIQAGVITVGGFILFANILSDLAGAMVNPLTRKEWYAIK